MTATALRTSPTGPSSEEGMVREVAAALPGGEVVSLRPISGSDTAVMADFLEALSPASRRLRFFQALPVVPTSMVRQLCEVDHHDHVAWMVFAGGRPIGEARFVRSRSIPWQAEVALAVDDGWRRKGVARLLLGVLGIVATMQGVTTFTSDVMTENRASQKLFTALGTAFRFEDGSLAGVGPVPAWDGSAAAAEAIREVQAAMASPAPFEAVA